MVNKPNKTRGLGRGLSALMSDVASPPSDNSAAAVRADLTVPVDQIVPNPNQPRRHFNDDALEELAASIREKGIIQPLIVRRHPTDPDRYEIVAGERRWRAAQRAQLHDLPIIVRQFDDTEVLEIAIIENIQRADLDPVDEANGYRQLMERFGHTQEHLASALGKSRSHIANQIRLLSLPEDVLSLLRDGRLTAGHARALIGHERASSLAQTIVQKGLSVREVEKLVKSSTTEQTPRLSKGRSREKDADTVQIERELAAQLNMPVEILHDNGGESGSITLRYKDLAQLDDLLRLLSGS